MKQETRHLLLFVAGVALAIAGMWLLSRKQQAAQSSPDAQAANSVNGLFGHYAPGPGSPNAVLNATGAQPAPEPPNPHPLTSGISPAVPWQMGDETGLTGPWVTIAGSGSAMPVQDNTALIPAFPWGN